jgi:hypothetical protein
VSPFAAEALAEGPRALTRDPVCGIDGKLAPVVGPADDVQAPEAISRHEERHAVRDLVGASRRGSAVRAGVRSEEGPREIVMRSNFLAGGVEGFARVLEGLLRAVP